MLATSPKMSLEWLTAEIVCVVKTPFFASDWNRRQCRLARRVLLLVTACVSCFPKLTNALCERVPLQHLQPSEIVRVQDVPGLQKALRRANRDGHVQIKLADGVYQLSRQILIKAPGITLRGNPDDRNKVILRGRGMNEGPSHVIQVGADDFTVADLTAGWVTRHVVQVHGESGVRNTTLHNVRLVDAREQLVKVSFDHNRPEKRADGGVIEWSRFEFTDGHTAQPYSGGISAISTKNWIVRHNEFINITSPEETPTGPAILFWHNSEDTRVEGNRIANSDRGIQFGLVSGGHIRGLVVNNFVHSVRDVGIGLEHAPGARVLHNSVFVENYYNAIEYRFDTTRDVIIANNLVNQSITSRNGGKAHLAANVSRARQEWFVDASGGNLRLSAGYSNIVDQADAIDEIEWDFDCEHRPKGIGPDIGAAEYAGLVNSGLNTGPSALLTHLRSRLLATAADAKPFVSRLSRNDLSVGEYLALGTSLATIIAGVAAISVYRRRRRSKPVVSRARQR